MGYKIYWIPKNIKEPVCVFEKGELDGSIEQYSLIEVIEVEALNEAVKLLKETVVIINYTSKFHEESLKLVVLNIKEFLKSLEGDV